MSSRRTLLSGLAAATLGVPRLSTAQTSGRIRAGSGVLEAIEGQLREDLGGDDEETSALTRKTDPVLADLWDNVKDSAYDRM